MTSDLGQVYAGLGLVIRDELVQTVLYAGTEKEKWVQIRVTDVRADGWEEERRDV
jgi:hypothetical protein